jgi:uncharacterized protein YqhQ
MSENSAPDAPVPASTQPPEFGLGGQALIEGVMMRSPHFIAASVRLADGSIETRVEKFDSIAKRHRWMGLPFLRGTVALVEMMIVGMRFLNWSAQKAMQEEASAGESAKPVEAAKSAEAAGLVQGFAGAGAVVAAESIASPPDASGNDARS